MNESISRVLQMLEEGQINAEEAEWASLRPGLRGQRPTPTRGQATRALR